MITNEPSTQQTPLTNEPADPPQRYVDESLQPVPQVASFEQWPRWLELTKAVLLWVASLILLIGVPLILSMPYFFYLWFTSGQPQLETLTNDRVLIFLSIIAVAPAHLLTFGLIWLMVTEGKTRPFWKTIRFEWPANMSAPVVMLTAVGLALMLLLVGGAVTYFWGGSKTQLDLLVESSIAARWATAFVAVFTAPLIEELIYRGVMYSALEQTLGTIIAIIVVSLLFAGVHVFQYINNAAVITVITVLSITLTVARAYTRSMLPSFIIHLVFNGVQSVIIALSPFIRWGSS